VLVTVELNADDLRRAILAYATAAYGDRPMKVVGVSLADRIKAGGPSYRYAVVELESLALRGESDERDDDGSDGRRPWTFLPRPDDGDDDGPGQDDGDDEDRAS
jgi:hypothetical protein